MNTLHRLILTSTLGLTFAVSMRVATPFAAQQDQPPAPASPTPPPAAPAAPDQPQFPMPPAPGEHHKWLEQLVGEWTMQSEMNSPGSDAIKGVGTESVRSIGGRWIVSELKSDIEAMGSMTAVHTLGYDSAKGKYQGTWIDSIQDHLWVYTGAR